jgi:hypothetical protein
MEEAYDCFVVENEDGVFIWNAGIHPGDCIVKQLVTWPSTLKTPWERKSYKWSTYRLGNTLKAFRWLDETALSQVLLLSAMKLRRKLRQSLLRFQDLAAAIMKIRAFGM